MDTNYIIYYSISKNGYAGWKFQMEQLFSSSGHKVVSHYYKHERLKWFKCVLYSALLRNRKSVFILPNIYGENRFYWYCLKYLGLNVLPRISGGELRFFDDYKWLAKPLIGSKIWVLNQGDFINSKNLGLIPILIPNSVPIRTTRLKEINFGSFHCNKILMCGTLSKRKGQIQIIEWLKLLGFDGTLTLVGPLNDVEGEGRSLYNDVLARKENINFEIDLLGEVNDMSPIYQESDLMILNSSFEGMPNVVLEAISFGVVTIGTNIPGTRDILALVDPKLCYEPNNFTSFTKSLDWVARRENYANVSVKGIAVVKSNFSIEEALLKLKSIG